MSFNECAVALPSIEKTSEVGESEEGQKSFDTA